MILNRDLNVNDANVSQKGRQSQLFISFPDTARVQTRIPEPDEAHVQVPRLRLRRGLGRGPGHPGGRQEGPLLQHLTGRVHLQVLCPSKLPRLLYDHGFSPRFYQELASSCGVVSALKKEIGLSICAISADPTQK